MEKLTTFSLLGIGISLIFLSSYFFLETKTLIKEGTHNIAKIIAYEKKLDKENGEVQVKEIYGFRTKEGEDIRIIPSVSYSDVHEIGHARKVVYHTAQPNKVKFKTYWGLYFKVLWPLIIACPFLVVGIGYFTYLNNRNWLKA